MKVGGKQTLVERIGRWWAVYRHDLPPDFDRAEYLQLNPDVAQAHADPVQHFLKFGRKEGRSWRSNLPRLFDPAEYLRLNPDVAEAKVDPVQHFIEFGRKEQRRWKFDLPPNFDPVEYLRLNPDVANANFDPVQHYIEFGRKEGRAWKRPSASDLDTAAHCSWDSDEPAAEFRQDISWESGLLRPDPLLAGVHGKYNILVYLGRYWAVPQALGPVDFKDERCRSHPDIISAKTHGQLLAMLGEPAIEHERVLTDHSVRGQNVLSSPLEPPIPTALTPEALHQYAKIVGPQKLFSTVIPLFRKASTAIQGFDGQRNRTAQPREPSVLVLGELDEPDSTVTEDNTRVQEGFSPAPGPPLQTSEARVRRLRMENPAIPHREITEHKYAKVIGARKLISVVIPYFRKSSTMLRCLEALRDQEYELCNRDDIEIIIIDDGTPGETIHESLPEDVHYIWQKKIRYGISRAKNTGAKLSNGRYIAFLDPDMIIARNYFDNVLRGFAKFGDRVVQTGYIFGYHFFKDRPYLQDTPDPRTEFGVWENPGIPTRRFYQVAGPTLAIARDLFNETPGFDEDLIYGGVEDLLFGYHLSLIPGTSVVFNREMEMHHIPHPMGGAHLNVDHTWEVVKRKWPEFYADYRENGSR